MRKSNPLLKLPYFSHKTSNDFLLTYHWRWNRNQDICWDTVTLVLEIPSLKLDNGWKP
jgi:hypothetical protein